MQQDLLFRYLIYFIIRKVVKINIILAYLLWKKLAKDLIKKKLY